MSFFSIRLDVRVTPNTKKMIEELQEGFSEDFEEASDVIRAAIIRLHKQLLPKSRTKGEITGFKDFKPE